MTPWLRAVGAPAARAAGRAAMVGLLGCVGLAAGCSPPPATAASPYDLQLRAAFDLGCPVGWVKTYRLDARTTGVEGCGRRLTYVESCSIMRGKERCTWLADAASVIERRGASLAGCADRQGTGPAAAIPETRDGRAPGSPAPAPPGPAAVSDPFADRR